MRSANRFLTSQLISYVAMTQKQASYVYLFLSVTGHGLLFVCISLQPVSPPLPVPKIQVALINQAQPKMPTESQSTPQPTVNQPMKSDLIDTETVPSLPEVLEPKDEPIQAMGTRLLSTLQAQLPQIVEDLDPSPSRAEEPNYQNRANPKLPGGSSLFDQWMGPVSPQLDRWSDPSGEINARVTLASGDVVCIQVRAPTTQELFNPWMSIAIPMARMCGREKSKSIDLTDPWLRARPK